MEIFRPKKTTITVIATQPFPGHMKAEEREEDAKQHGEEQTRQRERKVDGDPGLPTEMEILD